MSERKATTLVVAAGVAFELISFVGLKALGANNEILALPSLVCLVVGSFCLGMVGPPEPRRGEHRNTPHNH
jgi:amino acid permease